MTGHPLELGSHAKTETPSAQLADLSAELLLESLQRATTIKFTVSATLWVHTTQSLHGNATSQWQQGWKA